MILLQAPFLNLQALLDGLMVGAIFAFVAYGMALVWGVMNIINIVQGEFVILGGYITFTFFKMGLSPFIGIPFSFLLLFCLGFLIYRTIIFRVVSRDMFISILATFGISIVIQQLMNIGFGSQVETANSGLGTSFLFDGNITLSHIKIFSLLVCLIGATSVIYFMKTSKLGRAIRATAQNARAARILGVDTEKVYCYTYSINAAICGLAGSLVAMTYTLHPYIGLPYTVRSFMIVIVAGLGNFPAVLASGLGLGTIEEFSAYTLGQEYRIGFVFLMLVLILVYRSRKLAKKREYLK
jgi:branched-chain amino acid transport system permease protein